MDDISKNMDFSKGVIVDTANVDFVEAIRLMDAVRKYDGLLEIKIDLYAKPSSLMSIKGKAT